MDKWKEIEAAAKKIGAAEIEINDRIKLLQLADDSYGLAINGALRQIDKTAMTDINNIRKKLDLPEDTSKEKTGRMPCDGIIPEKKTGFDDNPLIPTLEDESSVLQDSKIKKPKEEKHNFDTNPLIPSDDECGSPVVDGSIADKKDRKKEDKIDWDSNPLIPD